MNIIKRPIAYHLNNDSAVIWWETDSITSEGHGVVLSLFGLPDVTYYATSYRITTSTGSLGSLHKINLPSLPGGATITVRILGPSYVGTSQYSFSNLDETQSVRLAVINNPEGEFSASYPGLGSVVAKHEGITTGILSCGGIQKKHAASSYSDWTDFYNTLYDMCVSGCAAVFARSDGDIDSASAKMFPSSLYDKPYYAVSVGSIRIAVLDTTSNGRKGLLRGKQLDWAMEEFNGAIWRNAKYRVIMGQNPFRTTLWNQSLSFGDGKGTDPFLFRSLFPLLQKSGADLVLFGSTHSYQRGTIESTYPGFEGLITHYISCGGMTSPHTERTNNFKPTDPPSIVIEDSQPHYVTIDADSTSLRIVCRELDINGAVIDLLSIPPHSL